MASLSSIRDGLKTRLATITGLRTHDTVPDSINPPAAIVGAPEGIDYDVAMRATASKYIIPIRVYVGRASERVAQDRLDAYPDPSGASSVKAAIEGDVTLGGAAHTCRVVSFGGYGVYSVAGVDYLGGEWKVEVIG